MCACGAAHTRKSGKSQPSIAVVATTTAEAVAVAKTAVAAMAATAMATDGNDEDKGDYTYKTINSKLW